MDFSALFFRPRLRYTLPQKLFFPAVCAVALYLGASAHARAEAPIAYDIAASNLADALNVFGAQSGVPIAFSSSAVAGKRAPTLRGSYEPKKALEILLRGSGLTYRWGQDDTIIVSVENAQSSQSSPLKETAHPSPTALEEVVVATRRAQLPTETAAPVDLFTGATLEDRGGDDLAKKLQFLAPSFNYTRAQGLVTAVGTRPPSLRGMGIDQVLVLVNGHRRHASAVLDTNNGFGRGTVPVDLNAIPTDAIQRVEILRDGASAQYGSDAIAGVINIVLRDDSSGGMVSAQGGITDNGDGESGIFTGRTGFEIGQGGHLTTTAQVRLHQATNFAGTDTRVGRRTLKIGEPESSDVDLTLNAELPTSWGDVYGFTSLVKRFTRAYGGAFRLPSYFPAVYPDGFLPGVDQDLYDAGATVGAKGSAGSWNWDVSDTLGFNRADFEVFDTVNRSLGATTPRRFDTGAQEYFQNLVNATLSRDFSNVLAGAHLILGAENRYERYELISGEPNSYVGEGATGFPGFNPPVPVHPDRVAFSTFVDGSLSLIEGLDVGLAGRYEHYSDFGSHITGKGSIFWRPATVFALRGTASTGVRAPSLQQQYYSSVSSQFIAPTSANPTGLVLVRNAAVDDPIARALGATTLKEESSRNFSGGIVLSPFDGLTFTADYFNIRVADRIAYSEILQGAAVDEILRAHGVANANTVRFFTNAANTRTDGYELAVHWLERLEDSAELSLNASYADFSNKVTKIRQNPMLPALPLLAQRALLVITDSQPRNKFTFNGSLSWGAANLTLDVVRFGAFAFVPLTNYQSFGSEWSLDIGASYAVTDAWRLQAGIINATDNYPDEIVGQIDGRRFESLGGLGADGREYYVRATKKY